MTSSADRFESDVNIDAVEDEDNAARLDSLTCTCELRKLKENGQEKVCSGSVERGRIDRVVLSFAR